MRPGHHRPLGTTTWHRFSDWPADAKRQPELGDVIYETSGPGANDEEHVARGYRIVGLEETRTGWRILGERVEYGTVADRAMNPTATEWRFWKLPRGA